jgi:E3 ubiquitin-protein ligase BRE1
LIVETPSYKVLLDHASKLEHTISESGDELPRLRDELLQLRATRKEWEENILVRPYVCLNDHRITVVQAAGETSKEELRTQFVRKEADNLRLRDQREQLTSEVNERKHKDNIKMASLAELKSLAESRSVSFVVVSCIYPLTQVMN